jgi:hypothetical protein
MNIQTKIEKIRSQPEHIRMRYTVVSVFISMLFISVLWIFSVTASFRDQKEDMSPPVERPLNQMNQAAPATDSAAPSLNEWIKE